jgi:hypothetical protein
MEPQHFILCWSCVVADRQSANWRPNSATIATTMSNFVLIKSTLKRLDALVNERIQISLARPPNQATNSAVDDMNGHTTPQ